ncbi:MAG: cytochrome c biogenesis CcdA family protein [Nitriliruptorales bacterium]
MSLAVAFGGGVVSFLSPCVLPIVPGYLTIITGLDVTTTAGRGRGASMRIARHTALFILGFTVVFVLLGLTATTLGRTLLANQVLLTRISGVVILAMALYLVGSVVTYAPWLYQEKRFHPELDRFGPFAAPIAGVAFGFGWTPCIGPILTSIFAVAATQEETLAGGLLLGVYSIGLGLPFLLTGLAFGRLAGVFGWVRRHLRGITLASAGSLGLFGGLLVFDRLVWITTQLQTALRAVGLDILVELG